MYGSGSYESGLSNAREIGKKKAQASYAKEAYKQALKATKKKTYDDAISDWTNPDSKEALKRDGAARVAEEIRNDPRKQEEIKAQGYSVEDYIDALYNASSDGKFRSEREYKQFAKKQKPADPVAEAMARAKKQESKGSLDKLKSFVKSKDTDGDGKPNGLLGALEIIDRPGDAVRTGIKEKLEGRSFLKGLKDGFTGEKDTSGTDLNKRLGFDPGKDTKDKVISSVLGKTLLDKLPGGQLVAPFVSKDIKDKIGKEAVGMATETVTDPLNLIGGGLVTKGINKLGKAAKNAAKAAGKTDDVLGLPAPKPEPLGLPEPQPKLPEPKPSAGNISRPDTILKNPIPEIPDVLRQPLAKARFESKGLGFGVGSKYEPKASNRMMMPQARQNQAYWQQRYEDFAEHVKTNYDTNTMTPETLEEAWTQFARYDEPVKLDELIDLAYPKGFEPPAVPKQTAPEPVPVVEEPPARTIKDDLKEDPRINEMIKKLYPPERPISRSATPEETLKWMEDIVAAQKKPQPSLEPLKFAREKWIRNGGLGSNINGRVTPLKSAADEVAAASEAVQMKPGKDFEPILPEKMVEDDLPLLRADDPIQDVNFDPKQLKDVSGFKAATTDVYRIFRDVFGDDFEKVGKPILNELDRSKKNYVDMQKNLATRLKTDVVDKLGIKKGSKESALVQQYGEGKISLQQLKLQAPDKWRDIVKADQWFRREYDQLIDTINAARAKAYPNNLDKQVPKLKNYYRHFRELNGLEGLKNIFESPSQIDPHLAGLSQHTNPSSKFHGFMQKRGLGPYKNDAVGGFLEYIPNAAYATHIDQVIPTFKNLRRQLADGTADSKNINNFIEFLYNYSNDLAGKTNPYFDRNLQQLVGRKTMAVLNWANNRVKKNVILGNVGSTLAQLANIPNGIAYAKPQNAAKGLTRTLTSIFDKNAPIHKSPFLQERYIGEVFRQFDQRLIDQPEKMAGWMIETADRVGTSFVWNSAYEKALKDGIKNPIAHADDMTRKLIAGRGIGEVPLMQKSKAVQLVMPFTLEVANLWKVMGDFVKTKDFGAIATLFVGNFLLNKAMEETRGSAVTFDPIDAIWDAFADEELTGFQRVGRVGGEVLTNVPLGQHVAGMYPENGQVFNIKGPTRKELFGERDPQRFGTGLVAANGLSDLAFKFALPFGGNQIKKTLTGIESLQNEGSYITDSPVQLPFMGENQKLRYPVEPGLKNGAKGLLFGPSATSEAQEYYDNKRRPLSEKQTLEYEYAKSKGVGKDYYNALMNLRKETTVKKKMKEISEDDSLTYEEKQEKIQVLLNQLK